MTGNTYTMKLLIDDSAIKKLEDRLSKVVGGGSVGASVGSIGGGGDNPMKQLGKLAGIAAGIGTLVIMVKKIVEGVVSSSPALQAMLKLLDVSIMLILRPFGDFVAFLLKPILIMFLQKVVLPFYKFFDAPMIKAGEDLGTSIANALFPDKDPNSLEPQGQEGFFGLTLDTAMQNLEGNLVGGIETFRGNWEGAINTIQGIQDLWSEGWEGLANRFDEVDRYVAEALDKAWIGLVNWFETLNIPSLDEIWIGLVNWFDTLGIPSLEETWNSLTAWFNTLNIPTLSEIWTGVTAWFGTLTIPEWMTNIWYGITTFFATLQIPQWILDIVAGFFDFIKKIGDWLAGLPDVLKNLLGLNEGGSDNKGGGSGQPHQLEINLQGNLDGAAQFGEDTKNTILSWFNEWLK